MQFFSTVCYGEDDGSTSHNNCNKSVASQLNWLNSLIDESRKPKCPSTILTSMSGQPSSAPGQVVTSMPTNFVLVSYDVNMASSSTSESSKRPLLVSIDASNSLIPTSGSTVILTAASSPIPMASPPNNRSTPPQALAMVAEPRTGTDVANGRCAINARSNSCGSASRKIVCGLTLKRQPSAFSDGAQDVFLPEYGSRFPPDDSAYSSYADCSNNNEEIKKQLAKCPDPLLSSSALNGVSYSEDLADVNHLGKKVVTV